MRRTVVATSLLALLIAPASRAVDDAAAAPGGASSVPAAAGAATASDATAGASAPRAPLALAVEKYTLPNGLEVLLHEDHRQPFVTVDVWYHVGARDETPASRGMAHLFEHLMFAGSRHVPPGAHQQLLEDAGALENNGLTDFDRTGFYSTVPRHELELALWLESDRMGFLLDRVTRETLDTQRGAIARERQLVVDDAPWGRAHEALWQAVFLEDHAYHGNVIGSPRALDAATPEGIRAFYDTWYAPSNATLCISGDIDAATIKPLIDTWFSSLPASPRPARQPLAPPAIVHAIRLERVDPAAAAARVEVMWLAPPVGEAGSYDLEVLASVLGDGLSGKLQDALILQSEQASRVKVRYVPLADVGVFAIDVDVRRGVDPADVADALQSQLDYLDDVPIEPADVQRAQARIAQQVLLAIEGPTTRAEVLQQMNQDFGDPQALPAWLAGIQATSAESVMKAKSTFLNKDRRAILVGRTTAVDGGSNGGGHVVGDGNGTGESSKIDAGTKGQP